jgi:hypothetical protein
LLQGINKWNELLSGLHDLKENVNRLQQMLSVTTSNRKSQQCHYSLSLLWSVNFEAISFDKVVNEILERINAVGGLVMQSQGRQRRDNAQDRIESA